MKKINYNDTNKPAQLYSCTATVSALGMVSYRTRIVAISDKTISMHLVHTSTTMQHTRKYIKYLRECGKETLANTVEALYRMCIRHKAQDAVYNCEDGTLTVIV